MAEAYDMLIEGVPAAMIENAAKMAGMPVGPLSLNDEVAIDLSQKILKASIADLGEGSVDLEKCIKELKNVGFDGWLSVEYEGEEDPLTAVRRSIENARKFL